MTQQVLEFFTRAQKNTPLREHCDVQHPEFPQNTLVTRYHSNCRNAHPDRGGYNYILYQAVNHPDKWAFLDRTIAKGSELQLQVGTLDEVLTAAAIARLMNGI